METSTDHQIVLKIQSWYQMTFINFRTLYYALGHHNCTVTHLNFMYRISVTTIQYAYIYLAYSARAFSLSIQCICHINKFTMLIAILENKSQ